MTPQELAQKAQELKDLYEAQQISESEFKELVETLILQESIDNQALQFEENIHFRNMIVNVVNIASTIAGKV
jgi:hypothetical protein